MKYALSLVPALSIVFLSPFGAAAQQDRPKFQPPPQFKSPDVSAGNITFRIHAPKAENVRLSSSDLPNAMRGFPMTKGENGVWEVTVEAAPGSYRYTFDVDGVAVIDPRNPATSEANSNTFSLAHVPGSDLFDTRDVPHGAVAQVTYQSKTLNRPRRMHVYTPPGYETSNESYPVFYLLHGATDCDNSWSSVGRAGFILDNLIAAGKAKPMIVVMPMGHTGPFSFGGGGGNTFEQQMTEFVDDFNNDIRPLVEQRYRVKKDRNSRAIAGLSMGGAQTLNIAGGNLKEYGYVGVYSSGIFGVDRNEDTGKQWLSRYGASLADAEAKTGLKLLWFATGSEDFLVKTTEATVDLLKKQGLDVVYKETGGGHTWLNWRDYLAEFAPMLFQN